MPDGELAIVGIINTKGSLEDLKPTTFNYEPLGQKFADKLFMLPPLQPATADGIPVRKVYYKVYF